MGWCGRAFLARQWSSPRWVSWSVLSLSGTGVCATTQGDTALTCTRDLLSDRLETDKRKQVSLAMRMGIMSNKQVRQSLRMHSIVGKNSRKVLLPNPANHSRGVILISRKPKLAFLSHNIEDLRSMSVGCSHAEC